MKWLKLREAWAWGYSDWKYRPLYLDKLPKEDRVEIEEEMNDLGSEFNYSDKFREIEWEIISTKQVPNKHIEAVYKGIQRRIHHYKEAIKEMEKSLPIIAAEMDQGRKTCPDQVRRDKSKKRLEEARQKKIKRVEKHEKAKRKK